MRESCRDHCRGVAFRWKDYRADGAARWKTMRLHPHEFIRRFLLHVLPKGFHRIRHYGLLASANRAESIATARALLGVAPPAVDPQKQPDSTPDAPRVLRCPSAWYDATSLNEEKTIARRLNKLALDHVLYAPLGVMLEHYAWRKNVGGIVQAPLPLFWGVTKSA